MVAVFHYNIPRHRGRYGAAVSVFADRDAMRNGEQPLAYFKTYRYQHPDDGRVCDSDRQEEELRARVAKRFPDAVFIAT